MGIKTTITHFQKISYLVLLSLKMNKLTYATLKTPGTFKNSTIAQ